MAVHTPGGVPHIHDYRMRFLDILEEEGASLRHVILNHVQLHPRSLDSQMTLARAASSWATMGSVATSTGAPVAAGNPTKPRPPTSRH